LPVYEGNPSSMAKLFNSPRLLPNSISCIDQK
jgi:hypothetical protein